MNDASIHHDEARKYNFWSRAFVWSAIVILAYYLLMEHRAHVFAALPWLLFLACPLMHIFMGHGKHGGHGESHHEGEKQAIT